MIRIVPTPARASREASAEPVAPQPTIATRAIASRRCPSAPIPLNRSCREYLASGSKDITSFPPVNHYYRGHSVARAEYNIAHYLLIESLKPPQPRLGGFLRLRGA